MAYAQRSFLENWGTSKKSFTNRSKTPVSETTKEIILVSGMIVDKREDIELRSRIFLFAGQKPTRLGFSAHGNRFMEEGFLTHVRVVKKVRLLVS